MTDWWHALDDELAQRGDDAPDPWGSIDVPPAALTPDQRAFLEQVVANPIHGVADESDEPEFGDTAPGDTALGDTAEFDESG
jgi:hypothetical protein